MCGFPWKLFFSARTQGQKAPAERAPTIEYVAEQLRDQQAAVYLSRGQPPDFNGDACVETLVGCRFRGLVTSTRFVRRESAGRRPAVGTPDKGCVVNVSPARGGHLRSMVRQLGPSSSAWLPYSCPQFFCHLILVSYRLPASTPIKNSPPPLSGLFTVVVDTVFACTKHDESTILLRVKCLGGI